jgi:hypothetical protein
VNPRSLGPAWRAMVAMVATSIMLGCEQTPITSTRLEGAIAPTFARLVHLQVSWLGLPQAVTADLAVIATCRKLAGGTSGSGEWTCTLDWKSPDRQTLRDAYDLFVSTDGCYMAMAAGENLGGPTLKSTDGRDVRNLLYAFDGCFDTT